MGPGVRGSALLRGFALAAIYVVAGKLGLMLDAASGFAASVWPPTGIALAALLIMGRHFWPAIAAGAFVVNLWAGAPIAVALGIAAGNTLEAVVSVEGLRAAGFAPSMRRARDALSLVLFAALGCTLISASIGTTSLWLGGIVSADAFAATLRTWWLGDVAGALIVAPVLLTWSREPPSLRISPRLVEGSIVQLLVITIGVVVFTHASSPTGAVFGRAYVFFPPLMWAALRFGPPGATLTTLCVAIVSIAGTAYGKGPFVLETLNDSLFALQVFMVVAASTTLVLTAISNELRTAIRGLERARGDLTSQVEQRTHALRTAYVDLQKREAQLAEAQELTHIGSWEWDVVGNHVTWTDELYRIFGLRPAEVEATYTSFLDKVHPSDRATVDGAIQRALSGEEIVEHVHRIIRPDRVTRVVTSRGRVFKDGSGKAVRLAGTVQDITEINERDEALRKAYDDLEHRVVERTRELSELNEALRGSEGRKAAIMECALDCIITMDPHGMLVDWNPAAEQTFGRRREEVVGKELAETIIPHAHRKAHREGLARFLASGQSTIFGRRIELVALRADGSEFPCEVTITATGGAKTPHLFIAYLRDLTERKRAEQDRRLLEQRVQEGQKLESLGVLAGGIAHDFNNILMAVLGNASLMRRLLQDSPIGQTHLTQIEEAARRATDLCRQMLAYAGKGRFVLQRTNLNRLIDETLHLLQVSISKKAVLRFDLYERLPSIVADATQLRQVLMNLVINASDAIGERSGVISIRTGVVRADRQYLDKTFLAPEIPEGDYVFLEVSDTGVGMDADTQARMFEPFFSSKFAGRGLGLSAVLGIVRGHKGAVKVYSEVGKGSSFKFLLPVAPGEEDRVERRPPRALQPASSGTILVVDDEETVRAVTSRMLEQLGFRALMAADGREAQSVYSEHKQDIIGVLMDLTMPHLDGEEAFRELRRIEPTVRVLLMSGYNEQDAIARFVGKGLAGFIQKPFTVDDLQEQLHKLLH